nr:endonuclease/exonuclease/phosphatase family protein [uncultured Porphyromonas sp.]
MVRKLTPLLLALLLVAPALSAQRQIRLTVAFYNLENLFDTIDGENNDADFLPDGSNQWTMEKYQQKLHNMAYAISQIGGQRGPDIIGLAEIENRGVLEDLLRQPELRDAGYQIVHFDSPDKRGIDCALFYRSSVFQMTSAEPHPVTLVGEEHIKTRDVLEVTGKLLGEPVSILVGHWPSRVGGEQASLRRRMQAAKVMRSVTDSLLQLNPQAKVILMGDFNDDPTSPSVVEGLRSKNSTEGLQPGELFNPLAKHYLSGRGTLAYRDVWNLFDNIIVSQGLLTSPAGSLHLLKDAKTGDYGHIFDADFLIQKTGHFKGYPFRTFSSGRFQGGYSDHFPTYIYLTRTVK